jgi:NAD(P)H-dependent FMN reductase
MTQPPSTVAIVVLNGSPRTTSRTGTLLGQIAEALADRVPATIRTTGVLKHIFDLVDRDALAGRVALLAATGGTPLHGLIGDHQLRPLLGFFRAVTVPTVVYATAPEVADPPSDALQARINQAADEAAWLLSAPRPGNRLVERRLATHA